ncbi:MAG: hypothetical protein ACYSTG_05535 [Planctomycetota bacterium]|jgi:hypothetical protein
MGNGNNDFKLPPFAPVLSVTDVYGGGAFIRVCSRSANKMREGQFLFPSFLLFFRAFFVFPCGMRDFTRSGQVLRLRCDVPTTIKADGTGKNGGLGSEKVEQSLLAKGR